MEKNIERSQQARAVLEAYCTVKGEQFDTIETEITDLVTALLHLAHQEGLDAGSLCRMAQLHFTYETTPVEA